MKLTKKQLKRIIKEEIQRALNEGSGVHNYGLRFGEKITRAGMYWAMANNDVALKKFRRLIKLAHQPGADWSDDFYTGLYHGLSKSKLLMGDSKYRKLVVWAYIKMTNAGNPAVPPPGFI